MSAELICQSIEELLLAVARLKLARREELRTEEEAERRIRDEAELMKRHGINVAVVKLITDIGLPGLGGNTLRVEQVRFSPSCTLYTFELWFMLPEHRPFAAEFCSTDEVNWKPIGDVMGTERPTWIAVVDVAGTEERYANVADALIAVEQ